MERKASSLFISVAMLVGLQMTPYESRAQSLEISTTLACSAPTASGFAGGFEIERTCGGHHVSGIGTYVDDATENLNGFIALLNEGVQCSFSSELNGTAGAFKPSFGCSMITDQSDPPRYASSIVGLGTTITDAGVNVLQLAELLAATNYRCSLGDLQAVVGGFVPSFGCGQRSNDGTMGYATMIGGIGSTATDAAENSVGFAELYAARNISCKTSSSSIELDGLSFKVRFTCTGHSVTGYGSTLTSAGRDALLQAQML